MLMRSDSFRWVRKVFALLPPRRRRSRICSTLFCNRACRRLLLTMRRQEGYFKENPRSEQAGKRDVVRAFPARVNRHEAALKSSCAVFGGHHDFASPDRLDGRGQCSLQPAGRAGIFRPHAGKSRMGELASRPVRHAPAPWMGVGTDLGPSLFHQPGDAAGAGAFLSGCGARHIAHSKAGFRRQGDDMGAAGHGFCRGTRQTHPASRRGHRHCAVLWVCGSSSLARASFHAVRAPADFRLLPHGQPFPDNRCGTFP